MRMGMLGITPGWLLFDDGVCVCVFVVGDAMDVNVRCEDVMDVNV